MQVGLGVAKLSTLHVNQESEMSKEVRTKDWFLHIRNDENPRERSSESGVEGE